MIEAKAVTKEAARRYYSWKTALYQMCRIYEKLEAAKGRTGELALRRQFHDAAKIPDNLRVPQPWRSWEDLGDAMAGRRPHHRNRAW